MNSITKRSKVKISWSSAVVAGLLICSSQLVGSPLAVAEGFPQPYSFELEANPNGHVRNNYPAVVSVDFPAMLQTAGVAGNLNASSLRVVELGAGGETLNSNVPFQFDPAESGGPGVGELVYFLSGQTAANAKRRFQVHFDTAGTYTAPTFESRVKLAGSEQHENQLSYKIEMYDDPQQSVSSTWYFHKQGGGFASLDDKNGDDWIGYRPTGGGTGNFRGIPNLGHPGNFFHPGGTAGRSRIVNEGPLRVTIASERTDGKWASVWDMYPDFAQMTVLRTTRPYWFLYEGTPGGKFEGDTDFLVRADGETIKAGSSAWRSGQQEFSDPEWVYFADPNSGDDGRALFFVHHENDDAPDTYRPFGSDMTVFGFGRKELEKSLTGVSHFTVGLMDETGFDKAKPIIEGAYLPLLTNLGPLVVVPEPAAFSLLVMGMLLSMGRRR